MIQDYQGNGEPWWGTNPKPFCSSEDRVGSHSTNKCSRLK